MNNGTDVVLKFAFGKIKIDAIMTVDALEDKTVICTVFIPNRKNLPIVLQIDILSPKNQLHSDKLPLGKQQSNVCQTGKIQKSLPATRSWGSG